MCGSLHWIVSASMMDKSCNIPADKSQHEISFLSSSENVVFKYTLKHLLRSTLEWKKDPILDSHSVAKGVYM